LKLKDEITELSQNDNEGFVAAYRGIVAGLGKHLICFATTSLGTGGAVVTSRRLHVPHAKPQEQWLS